jgi:hypothetical protein
VLARAVVAFGDVPLEFQVLHGVVFGLDGEPLVAGVQRRPLADGPRLEDAAHLQPEVEVEHRGVVLLHDEAVTVDFRHFPARLRRAAEVSLLVISFEPHFGRSAF